MPSWTEIVELCDDERYSDKTMGVVVLQGNAQAGLIEGKLLERLGAGGDGEKAPCLWKSVQFPGRRTPCHVSVRGCSH